MAKKKTKMTKEIAERICYKADTEGLAYAIQNGCLDELGTCVAIAREALTIVEHELDMLKDKYEIETA